MTDDERRLLEARWRLQEITASDLHAIADELLSAGEDTDALIRLFSLDRDQLRWEGGAAFEELLRECGGGTMDEREAVEVVLLDMSSALVQGTIEPLQATSRTNAIHVRTGYCHEQLYDWYSLHEEITGFDRRGWSYLGRDRVAVEADVMSLARSVVARHS